jgi:hypothetical protein
VANEESLLIDNNEIDDNRPEEKTSELISFDSDHFTPVGSSLDHNFQNPTVDVNNSKQID